MHVCDSGQLGHDLVHLVGSQAPEGGAQAGHGDHGGAAAGEDVLGGSQGHEGLGVPADGGEGGGVHQGSAAEDLVQDKVGGDGRQVPVQDLQDQQFPLL